MAERAERYDRVQCKYQGKDGRELIDKLPLDEGSSVLDLGCGTGYFTSLLAERVGERGRVTGVDPDANRIAVAKQNYAHLKNVTFLEGSSESFPGGPYDLIFSNHVLHWIEDKESTFERIHSSLKKEGVFAFVCVTETDSKVWDVFKPSIKRHFHICGRNTYEKLADKLEFKIELMSVESSRYLYQSTEQLLEYLTPSVCGHDCYVDMDIVEKFKQHNQLGDQQIYLDFIRISSILKKVVS